MPDPIIEPSAYVQQAHSEWEAFVSEGLIARENRDTAQWKLGYLADQIFKDYGFDAIGKYAVEIGVLKTTLKRYRDIYRGWKDKKVDPSLSFSHHMIALGFDDPQLALEYAREENLSCEAFRIHLNKQKNADKGVVFKKPAPDICKKCGGWEVDFKCTCRHK